jgi:hypothetical protein
MFAGAAAGVISECRWVNGQIAHKAATLSDLKAQDDTGRRRLGALTSPGGRERMLVERGYIKPGSRLLLFPRTAAEQRAAQEPVNDLVRRPAPPEPSFLGRIGHVFQELRGGA